MSNVTVEPSQSSGVSRGFGIVRDSLDEIKKVTTPTRQETIQATIVTMFVVSIVSILLFCLDFLFNRLMVLLLPNVT